VFHQPLYYGLPLLTRDGGMAHQVKTELNAGMHKGRFEQIWRRVRV